MILAAKERVRTEWRDLLNPRRVSPTRSLVLLVAGAVTGLALAGYGLFTARGTTTYRVPPEDVALVNQRPVLRTDYIAQIEAETSAPFAQSTPAQRRQVLQEMIREELFVQRGLELDFPGTDPDTRTALVAAVEQQVWGDVAAGQPSEAALREHYAAHPEKYATEGMFAQRHFLLPPSSTAAAARLVDALRAGDRPDAAAQQSGATEIVHQGSGQPQFAFAQRAQLGDVLYGAVVGLADGAVTPPLPAPDGIHVILMLRNIPPQPRSFAQARGQVLMDYNQAARARLSAANERFLRDRAEILTADDALAAPAEPDPKRATAPP